MISIVPGLSVLAFKLVELSRSVRSETEMLLKSQLLNGPEKAALCCPDATRVCWPWLRIAIWTVALAGIGKKGSDRVSSGRVRRGVVFTGVLRLGNWLLYRDRVVGWSWYFCV